MLWLLIIVSDSHVLYILCVHLRQTRQNKWKCFLNLSKVSLHCSWLIFHGFSHEFLPSVGADGWKLQNDFFFLLSGDD